MIQNTLVQSFLEDMGAWGINMDMLLKIVPMLFVLFSSQWSIASVPIPEKYLGEWSVTLERQSGFPWWLEVKYPVNLGEKGRP